MEQLLALRSMLVHISDGCIVSVYYWWNTPLKSGGLCISLSTLLLWECEHAETPSLISPKISGVVLDDSFYVMGPSADARRPAVLHRLGSVWAECRLAPFAPSLSCTSRVPGSWGGPALHCYCRSVQLERTFTGCSTLQVQTFSDIWQIGVPCWQDDLMYYICGTWKEF